MFLLFLNLYQILNTFQEEMTLIAAVFPQLPVPKNVVRSMSKKLCFRGPFQRQHGKCFETLLQYGRQHLYKIL